MVTAWLRVSGVTGSVGDYSNASQGRCENDGDGDDEVKMRLEKFTLRSEMREKWSDAGRHFPVLAPLRNVNSSNPSWHRLHLLPREFRSLPPGDIANILLIGCFGW